VSRSRFRQVVFLSFLLSLVVNLVLIAVSVLGDPNWSGVSNIGGQVDVWVMTKYGQLMVRAENNTWICPESFIDVYSEKPGVLTVIVNNKTEVKSQPFRFRQTVNLHISGPDGAPVDIIIMVNDVKLHFHYTLKAEAGALAQMITMTVQELRDLIQRITVEVLIKTFAAASIGIGLAYFVKTRTLLEAWSNPFNVSFGLIAALVLHFAYSQTLRDQYSYLYAIPLLLAQFGSYRLFSVGEYMHVTHVDAKNRSIYLDSVLTYKTPEGKKAIALQDWREALKRMLGFHVYIEPQSIPSQWSLNGESCVVVQSAEIKQVRDLSEVEKALQEYEKKEGKKVTGELRQRIMDWLAERWRVTYRVLHLDLVDAHKVSVLDWMIYSSTMNKLVQAYEELYQKYLRLRLQLRALIMHRKGKMVEETISAFDEFLSAHRAQIEQTLRETELHGEFAPSGVIKSE